MESSFQKHTTAKGQQESGQQQQPQPDDHEGFNMNVWYDQKNGYDGKLVFISEFQKFEKCDKEWYLVKACTTPKHEHFIEKFERLEMKGVLYPVTVSTPASSQTGIEVSIEDKETLNVEQVDEQQNQGSEMKPLVRSDNLLGELAQAPFASISEARRAQSEQANQPQANDVPAQNTLANDNSLNILFLGETGAGKSTSVNALHAYLRWPKYSDAVSQSSGGGGGGGVVMAPIAMRFSRYNRDTGRRETLRLGGNTEDGDDGNEQHDRPAESCTQSARSYRMPLWSGASGGSGGTEWLQVIDTPGIGDTRGVEQDRDNFDRTMGFIKQFPHLNAICILIQTVQTRNTSAFRYCIGQLLQHLHPSALQNLIFCFTYARSSDFGPGDGFHTLQTLLANEFMKSDFELKPGMNCFFVDNEGYRNLLALSLSLGDRRAAFQERNEDSWNRSAESWHHLIERVSQLPPHQVGLTNLLYQARQVSTLIAELLAQVQYLIEEDIEQIEERISLVEQFQNQHDATMKTKSMLQLHWRTSGLVRERLPVAKLVCTEALCRLKYKACHEPCDELATDGVVGSIENKHCEMIRKETGQCKACSHHWSKHIRLIHEWRVVYAHYCGEIEEGNTGGGAASGSNGRPSPDSPSKLQRILNALQARKNEDQQSLQWLEDIGARLETVLRLNSNIHVTGSGYQLQRYLEAQVELARRECGRHLSKDAQTIAQAAAAEVVLKRWEKIMAKHLKAVQSAGLQSRETIPLNDDLWLPLANVEPFAQVLKN